MEAYQQQAIEFAYLHHRYLRGIPPRDLEQRGTAMLHRLAMLRPYVQFPQPAERMIQWKG
jgi:hypothetical protein